MVDLQRRRLDRGCGHGAQGHLAAAGGRQVDRGKRIERGLQVLVRLENDAILVRLGEDGRDDALAEGVVERVVDGRRGDAETAGGVAVDGDTGGKARTDL